jgi:hypothetical protein
MMGTWHSSMYNHPSDSHTCTLDHTLTTQPLSEPITLEEQLLGQQPTLKQLPPTEYTYIPDTLDPILSFGCWVLESQVPQDLKVHSCMDCLVFECQVAITHHVDCSPLECQVPADLRLDCLSYIQWWYN